MSIRAAIFDFDGTLFDSMSIWDTAGADYLRALGYTPEEGLADTIHTMSLAQVAGYMQTRYALPLSEEEIMAGINRTVESFYFHRAQPRSLVSTYLASLRDRGIRMCIATATDRYQIEAALARCGMEHFFEHIFTCTEVGHGKDEPHIFHAARTFFGLTAAEVAVFEDAYHAARTAKTAGFYVVGIRDAHEKRADELKSLAHVYIKDYAEAIASPIFY